MLPTLAKLLRLLNSETTPSQISLGWSLGMVMGFTPFFTLHNLLVLLLVLIVRVNVPAFLLGLGVFSALAYLMDPLLHQLGMRVLNADALQNLWMSAYNIAFGRLEHFNNSLVMGSTLVVALLFLPMLVLGNILIKHFRARVLAPENGVKNISGISIISIWIRGWGLSVFIVSAFLLVGTTVLFADFLVKRSVETVGSRVNGAHVELESARLSFDPMGFTLTNLQVTDAHEPLRNAVQIDRIKFGVEGYPLLRRKIVITDLNADGVHFNTPRTVSGALLEAAVPQAPTPGELEDLALPIVSFPNSQDIFTKEEWLSVRLTEQLRTELDQARTRWALRVAELPDVSAFMRYNARINLVNLAKPKFKGGQQQDLQRLADNIKNLEALREAARKDVERIQSAQKLWNSDWEIWAQQSKQLMAAPGLDLERLTKKYSLHTNGYANTSRALFGSQFAQWTETGLQWYSKLEPILENRVAQKPPEVVNGKGLDVKFLEFDFLPDFLIRSAKLSVETPLGLMTGEIRNVTNDQAILGHPMTFSFFAEKMPDLDDLEIEGMLNHIKPLATLDNILFKAHGVRITRYELMQNSAVPVVLSNAVVDVESSATLTGDVLAAEMKVDFKNVRLSTEIKDPASELAKVLETALTVVKKFALTSKLHGSVNNYVLDLRSDLDELLGAVLNRAFRQRADKLLADATALTDQNASTAKQQIDAKLSTLKIYQTQMNQRHKQGEAVLQKIEQGLSASLNQQESVLKHQSKATIEPLKHNSQDAAGKNTSEPNLDLIAQ